MLCSGPHQTEEPGERPGEVSSVQMYFAVSVVSDMMTSLKYSAQYDFVTVCFLYTNTNDVRVLCIF